MKILSSDTPLNTTASPIAIPSAADSRLALHRTSHSHTTRSGDPLMHRVTNSTPSLDANRSA
ncbi:hypothetical protein MKX07_008251 [Trichoderma sp. CBMAI-0711]|nr:hypothetical protein MKX07_008251 [Trichoderma sp. CBMAI-0711]